MKKPPVFVIISLVTYLLLLFAKWQLSLPFEALWFFIGAMVGIYLLDIAEEVFSVQPSPFRSVLFFIGLIVITFYLIASSVEFAAKGISFSLLLSLYMQYVRDWIEKKTVASWFFMLIGSVSVDIERISLYGFGVITVVLGVLFVLV